MNEATDGVLPCSECGLLPPAHNVFCTSWQAPPAHSLDQEYVDIAAWQAEIASLRAQLAQATARAADAEAFIEKLQAERERFNAIDATDNQPMSEAPATNREAVERFASECEGHTHAVGYGHDCVWCGAAKSLRALLAEVEQLRAFAQAALWQRDGSLYLLTYDDRLLSLGKEHGLLALSEDIGLYSTPLLTGAGPTPRGSDQ